MMSLESRALKILRTIIDDKQKSDNTVESALENRCAVIISSYQSKLKARLQSNSE